MAVLMDVCLSGPEDEGHRLQILQVKKYINTKLFEYPRYMNFMLFIKAYPQPTPNPPPYYPLCLSDLNQYTPAK